MKTSGLVGLLTAACRDRRKPTSVGKGISYLKDLVPISKPFGFIM